MYIILNCTDTLEYSDLHIAMDKNGDVKLFNDEAQANLYVALNLNGWYKVVELD